MPPFRRPLGLHGGDPLLLGAEAIRATTHLLECLPECLVSGIDRTANYDGCSPLFASPEWGFRPCVAHVAYLRIPAKSSKSSRNRVTCFDAVLTEFVRPH